MTVAAALWVGSFDLALLGALWLAIVRGRGPERLVAALFLLATVASLAARRHGHAFTGVETSLAMVDLGLLMSLWLISLYANRWWPMVAVGAQLLSSTSHFVKMLDPSLAPFVYARIEFLSSWPTVLALSLPMIMRSKRSDALPSWQPSLPRVVHRILSRLRMD